MPDIEVNIEIYCTGCGAGICSNATATQVRRQPCFQVEPCEKCMGKAEAAGREEGYKEGYEAGKDSMS